MEIRLEDSPSVLLSAGTDRTLQESPGRWPELPTWCWPPDAWMFVAIAGSGPSDLGEITAVSEVFNSAGEISGLTVPFGRRNLEIRSGESLTWRMVPRNA